MKDKIEQALNWRYATKKYDPNFQLDAETIALLEKSLQLTPSSYGLQPLHFFWIEDPVLREKVKEIAWNQQQIVDAAAVLVICAKNELDAAFLDAHADRMRDERAMEEAPKENPVMTVITLLISQPISRKRSARKEVGRTPSNSPPL